MRVGAEINREPASRYAPIGVHGRPVSDAYVTLKAALLQRFGPAHAACFARPDRDPRDETIGWIADVQGEARRWTELPPEEQVLRALDLEAYRADLQAYAETLRAGASEDDSTARSIAALLDHAIMVPDESHVHFVGDQPVLSFWGFRRADGGSVAGLGLAPAASAAQAAPPVVEPPVARRSWWRWLLWLLPLLLLLALLLLWLLWGQGCTALEPVLPAVERTETPVPGAPVDQVPGVVPGGPSVPSVGVVPAPSGAAGGTPSAPVPPPPPAQASPPVPGTPPAEPPPATPPSETPPPVTPPVPPPAGPPLEIPPEAARSGDVGFLDGTWRSQRGLVDNVTGESLEQRYRFGKDGAGEAIVRRSDGVECRGPVRGRFVDGRLVLEEEGSLTCPDGRTYDRAVTRCERTASGVTVCRGVNPDGSGYRVGLEKVP